MFKPSRAAPALLILILAALSTSCANSLGAKAGPPNPYATGVSFSDTSLYQNQQGVFTCPTAANVLPSGSASSTVGLNDQYTVCTDTASTAQILVHGQTSASSIVCVFPAQVIDAAHIYTKPDLTTGLPWYQCVDTSQLPTSTTGASFTFTGIAFNAAFIVEGPDVQTMQRCLYTNAPGACPAYSYGEFRN